MEKNQNQVLSGKPNIQSIEALEELIDYPADFLRHCAGHADEYYSPFPKKAKVRPYAKKDIPKKVRLINQPLNPLKEVQKRINNNILAQVSLPDYICGGVKGKSTISNALMHQGSRVLVTLDIENYFPSIRKDHIYQIWHEMLGCSSEVSDILTKITTYKDYLPQGAPTSTSLANIFIYSIDAPIRDACARLNISYSVWVDDIAFSGDTAHRIIPVALGTLRRAGLKVSRNKFRIAGPGKRKVLTGVTLGPTLSIPSEFANRLRAGIHKLRIGQIPLEQLEAYTKGIEGNIAYVRNINSDLASRLLRDLETAKKILLPTGKPFQE